MSKKKEMFNIIPKEILKSIGDGVICSICNLGYLQVEKVYDTKSDVLKRRIICNNCKKELQIVYQDKPFKIISINELNSNPL